MSETILDMSLPVKVADMGLRTMMQYAKTSLIDFMILLHGFILYGQLQEDILERLCNGSREMLMIFREWGKSTSVEDVAVKELAFDDESFVLIFGKSDDAAQERLSAIKRWFEMPKLPNGHDNPFRQLKPQKKRYDQKYKWAAGDFILANGNRCKAQGFMSSVLGIKEGDLRPTLIIIDDPTDPENPSDDEKMIKRLLQTITPLGSPKTRIIITLTPRRYTDLGMTLKRKKDSVYNVHFIPALDDQGKVTCPDFWLREGSCCTDDKNPAFNCAGLIGEELIAQHIKQKQAEVEGLGWSTEYMLRPVDDGTSLFPMKTLNPTLYENWTFKASRVAAQAANDYFKNKGVIPKRVPCVFGVDLAIGESKDSDYSSTTVLSCEEDKPSRMLHAERFQGRSFKWQKDRLYTLYQLFRPDFILVEINGWQIVFAHDMLEYQALMPIDGHTTHTEKHLSSIGIPSLKSGFENLSYEIPYGDIETRKYVDNFFHELHCLIFEKGKVVSITKYDDCPVSFWLAKIAALEVMNMQVHIEEGVSFS